ncbi:MAG: aminotransferase class V-fold PLP-dependent enzyme [Proteobacteria bacterium]|nr:aminotransferase class V-fold PLP-dependent enzyme [Pseudomonadota bacterium]
MHSSISHDSYHNTTSDDGSHKANNTISDTITDYAALLDFVQRFKESSISQSWQRPSQNNIPWYIPENDRVQKDLQLSSLGDSPRTLAELLPLIRIISEHIVPVENPLFMGHMTTSIAQASHEADILMSFFNQNLIKLETSAIAVELEKEVLCYFHQLIYRSSSTDHNNVPLGMLVSGGTMANLTALTVAKSHVLPESHKQGIHQALSCGGYSDAVILSSKRGHYSVEKITSLLGLGKDNLITVDVDAATHKVQVDKLARTIIELKKAKKCIIAYVALASSTETGSVDDLSDIAKLCQKEGIWLHVDAAWGGGYLLSSKLSSKLNGIEQADSVVIDGHKLLGTTVGCGMVYFRNPSVTEVIKHTSTYVLREDSDDPGRFHLEGSRPFYALKLWLLLHRLGKKGIAWNIEHSQKQADMVAEIIEKHPCFRLATHQETNILTYNWLPDNLCHTINTYPRLRISLESLLNQTHDHIHQLGWLRVLEGFVSKTTLNILRDGHLIKDATVFRLIPGHKDLKAEQVKTFLESQHCNALLYYSTKLKEFLASTSSLSKHDHTVMSSLLKNGKLLCS